MAQRFTPPTLPTPAAAYSQAVRSGSIVATAGQIAFDVDGNVVGEGDIGAQTRQTLANVRGALEAAGASLDDVIKTTVFLADMSDYRGMNEVYNEVFGDSAPARSTVQAALVRPALLVEIEALAVVGDD